MYMPTYILSMHGFMYIYKCLPLELKNGRIPEGISKRMGNWKTEEIQKFVFPEICISSI